jgi:PKD repeat protein
MPDTSPWRNETPRRSDPSRPTIVLALLLVALLSVPFVTLRTGATPLSPVESLAGGIRTTAGSPPLSSAASVTPARAAVSGPPGAGNWTELAPLTSPPGVSSGAMVYDPDAGEYVLFGGAANGVASGETWVFVHGEWTDLTSTLAQSPSARWYFTFVWDAADHYALLFGGRDSYVDFNDTWAFNGTAWSQIITTSSPPPETSGRAAYDVAAGEVWMYGGYSIMPGAPSWYNASWTYLAGIWTNITANVTGAPPNPHAVTYASYDSTDGYVLLYGGNGTGSAPACNLPGNTWKYSAGVYTNLTASVGVAPPVSSGTRMMADDPSIGGVLLYGGWDGGSCPYGNETWVYRGGAWFDEHLLYGPGPLWDGQMAGPGSDGSVLLFGGTNVPFSSYYSTLTWNFTPALSDSIVGSLEGVVPFTVRLTSTTVGVGPFTYVWSWGDGSAPNTTANASHVYSATGDFNVSLQIEDPAGRNASTNATVRVFPTLAAQAQATPDSGVAPLKVAFGGSGLGGVPPYTFLWTFGVGTTTATGATAQFTYAAPGRYAPILRITDSDGNQIVSQLSVTAVSSLAVDLSGGPLEAVTGTSVLFNATTTGGAGPFTFAWNFGDGTSLAGPANESHTYRGSGNYTVTVSVSDQLSEVDAASIQVEVVSPLAVSATTNVSSVALGHSVLFTAAIAGASGAYTVDWSGLPAGCPGIHLARFACTPTASGTYGVSVWVNETAGPSARANTTLTVTPPTTAATGTPATQLDWAEIGVLVVVVAAIALVAVWAMRRRPKA